ncbi:phosphonate C-P lyase system protein PhnL [Aestuariirhabdus sp. Z084]|uniref:phosphonate C-P lyase system protein PhnL n=1 Tax=Aestuariirhabdus haliotis TaxID=2918751 RepID=UPI00201B36B4|nr:phosphonate C-P lyase system protein PhnL [Aestuariirhabdus haliotis]MCL6416002.1 phosphonate C-P lyase system protein PhnL [Aestuariirhabdus haliotis]MCL6419965.1 phosphonate C-P lyase system protein PhnL [Aestuariirhabdus haliotis]
MSSIPSLSIASTASLQSSQKAAIRVEGLTKIFTLHNQGGIRLPVFEGVDFTANSGECTVLFGESGSGKSTLLRSLYANYLPTGGRIYVRHRGEMVALTEASSQTLLQIRHETIGYVSQFLRVIPRVSTLDVVSEPLRVRGIETEQAHARAGELLQRLHIPERLWSLPPGTFSGGEQQRVNIARGFINDYPILLLDEPTASLDHNNAAIVVELIRQARDRGTAIVGIFHDAEVREQVADSLFHVNPESRAGLSTPTGEIQS